MSKTFKITLTADEVHALISYHAASISLYHTCSTDLTARIHDLNKRLNRNTEADNGEAEPVNEAPTGAEIAANQLAGEGVAIAEHQKPVDAATINTMWPT